ncbi:hypothetical protein T484DRAFT_2644062 [Baffinella frigidus]|nr:hypothetical protein T484DRAFT_2644062 [Cryptophyta sp. CCMP2293]
MTTQYDIVGLRTWLRFTYTSPSEVFTGDYFTVKIPAAYSFTTTPTIVNGDVESYAYRPVLPAPDRVQDLARLPVLNVLGAVSGIPDTFGVTNIQGSLVTVKRCTVLSAGPDVSVSFALGPLLNRGYGSQNYLGGAIPAGIFEVLLRDSAGIIIEGSNLTNAPPVVPQRLKTVAVSSSDDRSSATTNLTIGFKISNPIPAGGELHVYLPDGFVVVQTPDPATFTLKVGNATVLATILAGDLIDTTREDASGTLKPKRVTPDLNKNTKTHKP